MKFRLDPLSSTGVTVIPPIAPVITGGTGSGSSSVVDATTTVKGIVQLAGDLGGTASLPTIKRTSRFIVAPYGDTRPADYTCTSATDNNVEIQAAMVAANALTNGGVVDLLDGTYVLSASLVPLNNVWLRGQGMFNTKLTLVSGATYAPIDNYSYHTPMSPWTNGIISDLELDCSNIDRSSAKKGINAVALLNCKFFRLYIHDATATGFGADDYTSVTVDNLIVENCGYTNPHVISAAAWSTNTFTFTTTTAHGYTAWAQAIGTITASGTPSNNDTVTIGPVTYTYKTALTGVAFEVLINGSAANALTNLKSAVNLTGTIGTDYGTGTTKHPTVTAGTLTSTTLVFTSVAYGTSGNSIATTVSSSNLSFGASTLGSGVAGSAIVVTGITPVVYNGTYQVTSVIDSTNFTVGSANNSAGLNFGANPGAGTSFGQTSDSIIGHNGIGIATGLMPTEAMIITNNYCSGNQNNNYLAEVDSTGTGNSASYIFSNNISISAGSYGYRNTGTINVQFNNNFDYGSVSGCIIATTQVIKTITAASWSGGVATFTDSVAHNYSVNDLVLVQGMSPTTWNGYYPIASVPTTTTFTVAIASNPGTALVMGNSQVVVHPVDGSSVMNNVFVNNINRGIYVTGFTNNLLVKNNEIIGCSNYGIQFIGSNSQIVGNKIHGSGQDGINIATGGGSYLSMSHLTVSENHVYNSSTRVANNDGISISPSSTAPIMDVLITNNQCYDIQSTKTQRYGILLANTGTLTNISVSNNDLIGNLTGAILVQNTGNSIAVVNNAGVNPSNKSDLGNITGSTTFDVSTAQFFTGTLTGNITAVMTTPLVEGALMRWVLIQDATGGRTLTLPANASAGSTLTLSTTANAVDVLTWVYESVVGKWRLSSKNLAVNSVGTLTSLVVTTPNGNNTTSATITQNDTTNNLDAVDIVNAGTGMAERITQNGVLGTSKYALFVDSSVSVAQVNSPLARMRQQDTSSTTDTLQLDNAGTGFALDINTGGMHLVSGNNIKLDGTSGTQIGTANTQKLAFYGSTPIVQSTGNVVTALGNLGLVASGTIDASNVTTGILSISRGGTGSTTQNFVDLTTAQNVSGVKTLLSAPVINTQSATVSSLPVGYSASVTNIGLQSASSYPSDDITLGTDGTARLLLYSYQRANVNSFGETIRNFLMRYDAKAMHAWYGPVGLYDGSGDPVGSAWKPWAWAGAHYEANSHTSIHGHYEIEVPDSTGAMQGRFIVPFVDDDPSSGTYGQVGVDKTNIHINQADMTLDAGWGVYRVGAGAGTSDRVFEFASSIYGRAAAVRWRLIANNTAESGSNVGSDFVIRRFDDSGSLLGTALFIQRSDGQITNGSPSAKGARMALVWGTSGIAGFSAQPSATIGASAAFDAQMSASTERVLNAKVTGDAATRHVEYADGKMEWGDGTNARDVTLARTATSTLGVTGSLTISALTTAIFQNTTFTVQDSSDTTKKLQFNPANITTGTTRTLNSPDTSGTILLRSDVATVQNKTLDTTDTVTLFDNKFTLQDNNDAAKQMQFQLSGITTGNTRTLTVPDTSDTITGIAATQTLTNKRITKRISSTASSSTPTPNGDTDDQYEVTALAANATFGAPTGTPTDGQKLLIRIKDNGTARTLAWNAIYINSGIATLPATTVISKTHLVGFIYDSTATAWVCVAADPVGY